MKTMTCKQLGGACDIKFRASTFEEITEISKGHAIEMYQKGDEEHIRAMDEMRILMGDPEAMEKWMEGKRREFESLPQD
jgi:hypothetical protein